MVDSIYELMCYVEGDNKAFIIDAPPTTSIGCLGKMIKGESIKAASIPASDLTFWMVNVDFDTVMDEIKRGKYRPNDRQLFGEKTASPISTIWPEPPPDGCLHVYVSLPDVGCPTLINVGDDRPADLNFVGVYEDIFIKVKKWGAFESSDIERNGIYMCSGDSAPVPNFVTIFERELDSKPGLARDAQSTYDNIEDRQFLNEYFGVLEGPVEGQSPEESTSEKESRRRAGKLEVLHLAYIASGDWRLFWDGTLGSSIKEPSMTAIFFQYFTLHARRTITARTSNCSWPFDLIAKCETIRVENKQLRKLQPCSDFLISKSSLPRLIVEVNSKPMTERPADLVRMLVTGAAVVRFANGFLDSFKEAKNFVLCALYIWNNGKVTRYSLFQEPGSAKVRCNDTIHWLDNSVGRGDFVRQLYNLRDVLERDEETEDANEMIEQLKWNIDQHEKHFPVSSFHTNGDTKDTSRNKRKRLNTDVDDRGAGRGATDSAELEEHGYEVEPPVFVDESGYVMESFSNMPSHIVTVYEESDSKKRFIAKKVRKQSNELEFLKYLNSIQPKSEHIISLHESFQTELTSWAILPELDTVADYASFAPRRFYGKVSQVGWGLLKGVAYLHQLCIAHRDIKPENLVVDEEFCLKIIDFDVAMRVKDENQMVVGQCGTKGWTAPEIEEKSMYSPIKADRWSTGKVLFYLLDRFREEVTVLRTTASELTAYNPDRRPSMLRVASSLSDVVNVAIAKASRSLQDTVDVNGEYAKPPMAKKQKVLVPDRMVLGDIHQ